MTLRNPINFDTLNVEVTLANGSFQVLSFREVQEYAIKVAKDLSLTTDILKGTARRGSVTFKLVR
jgi:hypothetical protein